MTSTTVPGSPPVRPAQRGFLVRMLDGFGSIAVGVTLLVLIFLYSSIGSAVPPIRQGVLADWFGIEALRFEMTEMEWFSARPFQALVILFSLSMMVATVRRVPLTLPNLGVWTIHTGILVMVIGCFLYFGRKIEGTAVVFQRAAVIHAPGASEPARLVIRPGAETVVGDGQNLCRVSVSRLMPRYEILTGDDKGKRTTAVWLEIDRPHHKEHSRFTRVLLAGYPDYTEDVLVGMGGAPQRARKLFGKPLIDEALRIDLEYEPQDSFFLENTAAVYARLGDRQPWVELPVPGLPKYYEHLSSRSDVWSATGQEAIPLRPIDLPALASDVAAQALPGVKVRVVGYLPYATLQQRWVDGGDALNPVVQFSLPDGKGRRSYELAAFDPSASRLFVQEARFSIRFHWAESVEQREKLAARHEPRLAFRLEGRAQPVEMKLADLLGRGPTPIADTGYRVTLNAEDIIPDFPLLGAAMRGQRDTLAVIHLEKGEKKFRRLVFAHFPDQSRDMDDVHKTMTQPADSSLRIEFIDPAPVGLLIVGGPSASDCELVLNEADGTQVRRQAPVGEPVVLKDGAAPLRIDQLIPKAMRMSRPAIVPPRERQPMQNVGATLSLVQVEVQDGADTLPAVWLPFNSYVFPHEGYAYPERFQYGSYAVRRLNLSGGRTLELLYGRQRRALPSPVVLDRFVLDTHPGGRRERDFISLVRFREGERWSDPREIRSNQPAEYQGLWFYQAQWDPGNEAITILGVGNREAVGVMLLGVCLSIAGMVYAFYVKPVILRRRGMPNGRDSGHVPTPISAQKTGATREAAHV